MTLTAEEARKITVKAQQAAKLQHYLKLVREEAEKGSYIMSKEVNHPSQLPQADTVKQLTSMGYDVSACWLPALNQGCYKIGW